MTTVAMGAGGLITSTILSLFYVPVVFTYVDDAKCWVKSLVSSKHAAAQPRGERVASF